MRYSRSTPSVNAGSMADIAFLLLIFFLVTTTIPNDKGIVRKLPRACEQPPCHDKIHERNILRIKLNKQGALLVNNEVLEFSDLKEKLKLFIDNNGDASCSYCQGNRFQDSSDNPQSAVISIMSDRESTYKDFIAIQVELTRAYHELRESYVNSNFNKDIAQLSNEELQQVRNAYPLLISEAEVK